MKHYEISQILPRIRDIIRRLFLLQLFSKASTPNIQGIVLTSVKFRIDLNTDGLKHLCFTITLTNTNVPLPLYSPSLRPVVKEIVVPKFNLIYVMVLPIIFDQYVSRD